MVLEKRPSHLFRTVRTDHNLAFLGCKVNSQGLGTDEEFITISTRNILSFFLMFDLMPPHFLLSVESLITKTTLEIIIVMFSQVFVDSPVTIE